MISDIVNTSFVLVVEDETENRDHECFRNTDTSRLRALPRACGVVSGLCFVPPILRNQSRCVFAMTGRQLYALGLLYKNQGSIVSVVGKGQQELVRRRKNDLKKTRRGSLLPTIWLGTCNFGIGSYGGKGVLTTVGLLCPTSVIPEIRTQQFSHSHRSHNVDYK